jgi:CobQ-like glutamine amidotransferase family enzyme
MIKTTVPIFCGFHITSKIKQADIQSNITDYIMNRKSFIDVCTPYKIIPATYHEASRQPIDMFGFFVLRYHYLPDIKTTFHQTVQVQGIMHMGRK